MPYLGYTKTPENMKQIFLAAAHMKSSPLNALIEEVRAINKTLEPLSKQGRLQLLLNRAASIEDIFSTFGNNNDIQIFHYAGHADGERLYLEEAGHIKGIAELFGLRKEVGSPWSKLRFVFLNGCATKGQVASLHGAGVAAVLATSRKVEDQLAKVFATSFYESWIAEGKTLKEAFEVASIRVRTTKPEAEIKLNNRGLGLRALKEYREEIHWGLYLNPELKNHSTIENWVLNEPPKPSPMDLGAVRSKPTLSLRELVQEFTRLDPSAKAQSRQERKDPLMVLIERLPWIVGTHLRRLFAVEPGRTMLQPGKERLRELISAYSSLTRFISYISLSMLWDSRRRQLTLMPDESFAPFPFSLIPMQGDYQSADYIFRAKVYQERLAQLQVAAVDPIGLTPKINDFLKKVEQEEELGQGYLVMEGWKQAMTAGEKQLAALIQSRAQENAEGLKQLVLEAEAIYTRFLKAALFLTEYKLHTVRSIVVDKLRSLDDSRPYSHYTISLHAAFSELQTMLTERETATDNYCLLLTRRGNEADILAQVVNLSPLYIDQTSYINNNTRDYPAVFTLDYRKGQGMEAEYYFHYIDTDVNHQYTFANDHQLAVNWLGAPYLEHIELEPEDEELFKRIHKQLMHLEQDIPHQNQNA